MSESLLALSFTRPALALLVFAPLLTQSPPREARNSLGPPLHVQLVDAYTGSPVVGAPVSMDGVPLLETTDQEGYVMFRKQGGVVGDSATIWTTPTGYAPSSKRVALSSRVNFTTLYLAPANAFSSGLIDPLVGGVFVFDDFLPTVPPTPFYLKVEVPAGALPEPLSINITPYPTLSLWSHGLPDQALQFGAVQINSTGSAGQFASETLDLPVTLTARGYAAGHDLGAYDLSTLSLYRFDCSAHRWVYDSPPTSIDPGSNTFSVQTNHLSILGVCAQVASPR